MRENRRDENGPWNHPRCAFHCSRTFFLACFPDAAKLRHDALPASGFVISDLGKDF